MQTVIIFLLVVVVLVVAHELGHFFVAKAFKVRVDEFGIGYAPRARELFSWKGTLFTLNWLPFGGFVKIFGEEGSDGVAISDSFAYKSLWKRALIVIAGVFANIILAIILYSISFGVGFLGAPTDFPGSVSAGPSHVFITDVTKGSPAQAAGLDSGDTIISLATTTTEVTPNSVDDVINFVQAHPADNITISYERGTTLKTTELTPKLLAGGTAPSLGVGIFEAGNIRLPFFKAIAAGVTYTFSEFKMIIVTLSSLVTAAFKGSSSIISQVSGPIGIAQIAGQAYSLGIGAFLGFVALISVNLAVINLLPFPALDGGRLIMELFASEGKSRIPAKVVAAVNQIGFVLLIILMLYVTYHDIVRLFT